MARPILNRSALAPAVIVASLFALACGGTTSHTRMEDPATLLAERDEWRGPRDGAVILRLHVEALIDTRPDPSKATSALVVHLVAASYGDAAAPIPVRLPVPSDARFVSGDARFATAAGTTTTALAPPTFDDHAVDPDQQGALFTLPAPPTDGVVEAIARFEIPGTLAADARWVGLSDLPVAELLLRYDFASDAVASFQTTLPNARPVVTEKDGRRLVALFAQNLAPVADPRAAPYARFVLVRAAPKGFAQSFTPDWSAALAPYVRGVVDASKPLDAGYEVPYRPAGSGRAAVLDAYAWVRGRPMRAAPEVAWDRARTLPDALRANDLTTVDRAHLLHWVLREAGIAHRFLVARAAARPPLDPAFPAPGVFDAPLVYVPELDLVLDPACDACTPGAVRDALRGGQAIALPPAAGLTTAPFITLPSSP